MTKNTGLVLQAILAKAEDKPQKSISMKRFGVDFTIQALSSTTFNKMREQATMPSKQGDKLDSEVFNALIIEKGCVEPNWTDKELTEKYGDPKGAIEKVLLSGEVARLSAEILELSGFTQDIDDLKN